MSPADWSGALALAAAFAGGYLLGSVPFGLILGKLAGLGDVREVGSGNIGATNVLRAGGKKLAALTLLLDAAKGTAAVLIAARFGGEPAALAAGLGAFLGHLYPVWLGFRGGKGVATYIGVMLGLYWPAALAFCGDLAAGRAGHPLFLARGARCCGRDAGNAGSARQLAARHAGARLYGAAHCPASLEYRTLAEARGDADWRRQALGPRASCGSTAASG